MKRSFLAATLLCSSVLALAQVPGSSDELKGRRSPPPGVARDGSAPAEGAIKGGSVEQDIGTSRTPRLDIARCKELERELREECLRDLANADRQRAPERNAARNSEPGPERR